MKNTLAFKTGLLSLLIAGVRVIGITYISYKNAGKLLQEQSLVNLGADVLRESGSVEKPLQTMHEDILFLSESAAIVGIIRASRTGGFDARENVSSARWKEYLARTFSTVLRQQIHYTQIRFIGIANHGRELVRVRRDGPRAVVVREEKLQEKSDTDYFAQTAVLKPEQVFFSRINLNKEKGTIQTPHVLVVRVAVPIHDAEEGKVFGIIVINSDFEKMAASLYAPPQKEV